MRVYADSSFLVSCYLLDANTARAKAFRSDHDGPLPFTALHELEVRNALRLGVFRQVITDEQAKAAAAAIDADLRNGRLVRTPVKWPAAFRATLRLSNAEGISHAFFDRPGKAQKVALGGPEGDTAATALTARKLAYAAYSSRGS